MIQTPPWKQTLQGYFCQAVHPPKGDWFTGFTLVLALCWMLVLPLCAIQVPNVMEALLPLQRLLMKGYVVPHSFDYALQWWGYAVVFLVLGRKWATLVYGSLLCLACFWPVFAEGGGWRLWNTPSLFYVLGAFIAFLWMSQKWQVFLKSSALKPLEEDALPFNSFLRVLGHGFMIAGGTVFILHILGLLGVLLLVFLQQLPRFEAVQWSLFHSLYALPYDFLGLTLLLWATRSLRVLLRPFLYGARTADLYGAGRADLSSTSVKVN
jgi:hypothetical protein